MAHLVPEDVCYLDHAATTPVRPAAWEAMAPFAHERFGNAAGSHRVARRAKTALEEAREAIAGLLGARPAEIVFTSGGTEADNLAVKGAALAGGRRGGVVTTAIEHEAVLDSARFLERWGHPVRVVPPRPDGTIDPDAVLEAIDDDTVVVSVMAANNETGALQPVAEIVRAVRAHAPWIRVHTDAVQAFVSEEIAVDELGVDLLSLAAHKFGGPKGVGLLYVREGVALEPVLHGGGHELGRRSGTSNVMGVVGMAAAMAETVADRDRFRTDVAAARRRFESLLVEAFGSLERTIEEERSLVQHAHLRVPGVRNETLLMRLDRRGVAASAASACQSGAATVSHVLEAMGMTPDRAREHIRFTFGWTSTIAEAEEAAARVIDALAGLPVGEAVLR